MIAYENEPILEDLVALLEKKHLTVSTAESCTGGLVGAVLTNLSGSSSYYEGGVIAYSNDVKKNVLHVREDSLATVGAVSEEVAFQMANGVKSLTGTSCSISTTGIAGPGGSREKKPVGLVYIGVSTPSRTRVFKHIFEGSRQEVRSSTVLAAITHLLYMLQE